MRTALCCCALILVCLDLSRGADGDPPRAVPVFRLQAFPAAATAIRERFEAAVENTDAVSSLLEFGEEIAGQQELPRDAKIMYQIDLFAGQQGYLASIAVPALSTASEEFETAENEGPSLTVRSGDYVLKQWTEESEAETEGKPAVRVDLYRQNALDSLHYLENNSNTDAIRVEFLVSDLKSTSAYPHIRAQIASALTFAQRRDNEPALFHAVRSAGVRAVTQLATMCLSDLESLSVGLRHEQSRQTIEAVISARVHRRSDLLTELNDLRQLRNRSLSWLHPDHDGFATVCFPVPGAVQEALDQLNPQELEELEELVQVGLADEFPLFPWLPVSRLLDSVRTTSTLECLVQLFKSSDGAPVVLCVIPLRGESRGVIRQAGYLETGAEIDGHSIWRIPEFSVNLHGVACEVFAVETDNCFAMMLGPASAQELLTETIRRDFDESPAARRVSRRMLAVDLPLDHGIFTALYGSDGLSHASGDQPPQSRMQMDLLFEDSQLILTTSFEQHAATAGLELVDLPFAVLLEGFEWLVEGE